MLVLATLAVFHADDVGSGLGWELIAGVGLATWLAHLYAEVVGDHLRHSSAPGRHEIARAMTDGLPILLAPILPGLALLLGRLDVLDEHVALWTAVAIAVLQLVALGALVGWAVSGDRRRTWSYAVATAAVGLAVVVFKVALRH